MFMSNVLRGGVIGCFLDRHGRALSRPIAAAWRSQVPGHTCVVNGEAAFRSGKDAAFPTAGKAALPRDNWSCRSQQGTIALPPFREHAVISGPSHLTLVLGGARSGKSRHAELLLTQSAPPWVYVATAQALDDEMRSRISEHQARREMGRQPEVGWQTIEAPIDLAGALMQAATRPVVVDCLTLWLTNLMLAGHDLAATTEALDTALNDRQGPTILVSNEVGLGVVPATPLGRAFRDAAGRLHQRMAARADRVLFMVAGLPLTVK
jgi:adenosylcobinamide kinase/adenosylcobinamide-phosphate guanylyltransferase